ncbi:ribosomal-processing cysteine protease Prp [Lactococcus hircilactis]|uniref:Ribosomal processing cysteine protease Prp n=1 Tax=Lactococcus hircilactis TaxID=1494462 RepID=A0A7X1Z7K4_9LACT|nr:ribosomal-processing cysteine protease Prp [Lactococcus hircilactis]MQW39183.1 ribosomal-processing cysteine protease Prp [Lactococcus hircilactis]
MIEAVIRKKRDRFVSYEISGHASSGTGEFEYDVVCADVSVLSITTANNIHSMAKIKPITKMEDGYLYVEVPISIPNKQEELVQILFQAFTNAMKDVVEEFPQYVHLTIED